MIAGGRSDSVVGKVWKDIGKHQEDVMSAENFGRYKTAIKELTELRQRLALRNTVKWSNTLNIHGGLGEGIGVKTNGTSRKR